MMKVRPAAPADAPRVIELVTGMFHDLGAPPSTQWQTPARERLTLDDHTAAYVTVDSSDRPIAVAVGVIDHRLPSPRRPNGPIGYVEWLATDPRHRRQGAARLAMTALLNWFDHYGVTTIDIHASAAARRIYEDLGFQNPAATPLRRTRSIDA